MWLWSVTQTKHKCLIKCVLSGKKMKNNWDINLCPYRCVTIPQHFKSKEKHLTCYLNYCIWASQNIFNALFWSLARCNGHYIAEVIKSYYSLSPCTSWYTDILVVTKINWKFQPSKIPMFLLIYHMLWNISAYIFYHIFKFQKEYQSLHVYLVWLLLI